ncbi:MAG: DNA cytosine methyltransferase [Bacteriovorax sp.]|jgi:DNA (cytosine-5)-methyltransferase 1|nr:DNA cytosine methyltransferase [Bacteriovorax sp.]
MTKINSSLNFIDVFSGAGGLSCGLELAGMRCLLGIDHDKNAIETFMANHQYANTYCGSVSDLTDKKLKELIKNQTVHAVVGGPPCQGFSTVGLGNPNDLRNSLFREFVRLVKITNPYFIIIENVTGLLAKKNEETLNNIFKLFHKMGYSLGVQVMSAENYGVPERRRRTIIIGSRINETIQFPKVNPNIMTVGQALKNLKASNGKIYNHDIEYATIKSKTDLERIKCIPEGCGIRYEEDELAYLPKKLKLGVDWKTLRENRFRQTKYRRLDRKKPSPTIMTHKQNYYHPTEHRYLTQREAAALQSFPNDFKFMGPLSAQWRQIGNAVPPKLGLALGKSILAMYSERKKSVAKKTLSNSEEIVTSMRKKAFLYK